jgi:hypothetical protein
MSTWIYILIGIVVLGFFVIRRMKKATGMPVLKARIGTSDGLNYNVHFEKLHPELKEIEYVRMVLNFTAKTLFMIEKKHDYVSEEIMEFIKNVSNTKMTTNDVEQFFPSGISIQDGNPNGKVVEGILYFKDMRTRNIMTKLPSTWFEYQLAHSVIVLIKSTLELLDEFHRDYLRESLRYMVQEYEKGVNPREMRSMVSLPNEAFLSRHM